MDVMTAIRTRRSIRAYKDKPIEDEKLQAVLEAGRLAPSARNMQEWKYVIVKDKALRYKLMEAANGREFVGQAPVVIAACAVETEYVMQCGELSYPIDVAISVDHMTLAATELGLGTCWMGRFRQEEVKKVLHIPEEVNVVVLLTMGYPDAIPAPKSRKSLEEMVTYDRWA